MSHYNNLKELKKEMYLANDLAYDPWSACMEVLFQISAELYHRGEFIDWSYSPGMASDPREPENYHFRMLTETGTEVLLHCGRVLNRYCDPLEKAGESY